MVELSLELAETLHAHIHTEPPTVLKVKRGQRFVDIKNDLLLLLHTNGEQGALIQQPNNAVFVSLDKPEDSNYFEYNKEQVMIDLYMTDSAGIKISS